MTVLTELASWEALDSRGRPTVACRAANEQGERATVTVPSGASTGRHEVLELRDGDPTRHSGRGVRRAVQQVLDHIGPHLVGTSIDNWRAVDGRLEHLDQSLRLTPLGGNAMLAASLAVALLGARCAGREPFAHLSLGEDMTAPKLPLPMVNMVSGGAHAAGAIDLQDVLVVPVGASSFVEAMEMAAAVREAVAVGVHSRGGPAHLVADEGGLGPALERNEEALELVERGIRSAGLEPGRDAWLAIDVAANELRHRDGYRLAVEDRQLTTDEMVRLLAAWCEEFPILSIEDGLAEDDLHGWDALTASVGDSVQLVGDDLFATNADRVSASLLAGRANALLIKPNQCGTLARAESALHVARNGGYRTVVSARSGETEDSWLADLAVGWKVEQIKVGSMMRSERTAKWNRLLEIEATYPAAVLADPFDLR